MAYVVLEARRPRGRHSRIEHRLQDAIGDIHGTMSSGCLVTKQRSKRQQLTCPAADLPVAYVSGNAEADLLAGQA
eukprot:3193697-Amphidinium_carterae.1